MAITKKINTETQAATIKRLLGNISAAREILEEHGHINLSIQLHRDWVNLEYWQRNGQLEFVENDQ